MRNRSQTNDSLSTLKHGSRWLIIIGHLLATSNNPFPTSVWRKTRQKSPRSSWRTTRWIPFRKAFRSGPTLGKKKKNDFFAGGKEEIDNRVRGACLFYPIHKWQLSNRNIIRTHFFGSSYRLIITLVSWSSSVTDNNYTAHTHNNGYTYNDTHLWRPPPFTPVIPFILLILQSLCDTFTVTQNTILTVLCRIRDQKY